MTYSQGSTHGQDAEINIIPLADVMLVLLIIFMIATPQGQHRAAGADPAAHRRGRAGVLE